MQRGIYLKVKSDKDAYWSSRATAKIVKQRGITNKSIERINKNDKNILFTQKVVGKERKGNKEQTEQIENK